MSGCLLWPTNRSTSEVDEYATVVIVGAGVAGLTLGNFLLRRGIDCMPLGSPEGTRCLTPVAFSRETAIPPHAERRFRAWSQGVGATSPGMILVEVLRCRWSSGMAMRCGGCGWRGSGSGRSVASWGSRVTRWPRSWRRR
ncbi:FAD-dependent monooxygenase, partial [Saccharopolyspora sp. 5N102]|uniref:FAD-dependent monooxygenase n=1 Tax=Saccharopolyspora sp. 5N102 TaxID=3375155 RepID=UPI0037B7A2AD